MTDVRIPATATDEPVRSPVPWPLVALGVLVVVSMAVVAGTTFADGGSWLALLIPVFVVAVVALLWLALFNFEWFVLTVLAVRASLDGIGAGSGTNGSDPNSLLSLLFLSASLVWLAAGWYEDRRLWRTRLEAAALFFGIGAIAATVFSQRLSVSAIELARLLSVVVMALVLARLMVTLEAVKRVIAAVFASAIVPIIVTYGAQIAGSPLLDRRGAIDGEIDRVSGTFSLANGFSRYLLFLMLMGAALFPHLPKRWKWFMALELAAMGGLMVLTYTRSSWVMLVVGLGIIGWYQSKKMLWGLIIGAFVLAVTVPSVIGRFSDLFEEEAAVTVGAENSLVWRVNYWTDLLPYYLENPFTGIGLRATELVAGREKAPHNDFVRTFVETGTLGFLSYLVLLAAFIWIARRAMRYARPGWERGVAVGYLSVVVSFLFVSFVSNTISQVVLLWYFLAFSSAAAAVAEFGRRARHDAPEAVAAGDP
jgi:hypothetical protein